MIDLGLALTFGRRSSRKKPCSIANATSLVPRCPERAHAALYIGCSVFARQGPDDRTGIEASGADTRRIAPRPKDLMRRPEIVEHSRS